MGCGQSIQWSKLPKIEDHLFLELFKVKTIDQEKEDYETEIDLTFHS